MILDHVAVLGGDPVLQFLDLVAVELDHLAAVDIDHVVVVFAAVELVHRMAALEVVLEHEAGRFELGQYPVDGGQADFLAIAEQVPVDVLGGHVPGPGLFQQFQDPQPRMGHLQPGLA